MMKPNQLIPLRYSDTICDDNGFKTISFESIFTAFIVLSIGVAMSVVFVIIEKTLLKKTKYQKEDSAKEIGEIAKPAIICVLITILCDNFILECQIGLLSLIDICN